MGPVRTCVGCRQRSSVAGMVRVARTQDGTLVVDRSAAGRGAWLCADNTVGLNTGLNTVPQEACLLEAGRRGGFARAFRAPVQEAAVAALHSAMRERARMVDATRVAPK